MSHSFAPGAVHGGWRVVGPSESGAHRWSVERDGRSATLTFFPYAGPRAALHRAIGERHSTWRSLEHEAFERVDTGVVEGGAYAVVPSFERFGDGALEPPAALAVLERVAQVLGVFHARGVAHGEVDAWSVVKRDGAAALLPPGLRPPPSGLEALGLQADPRYAAPEVLDGRAPTPEADVCSLGLLLFRLVTGQVPAAGADPSEVLMAREGAVPELRKLRPELPPTVLALYECLTAPRGLRPKDASAALTAIQQAARGTAPKVPRHEVELPRPARVAGPLFLLLLVIAVGGALATVLNTRLRVPSPVDGFQFRTAPAAEPR